MEEAREGPGEEALSEHEAKSVDDLARFHREHYRSASSLQRGIDRVTDLFGRPIFALALAATAAAWAAFAAQRGGGDVTQPSFAWLELTATLMALMVSVLILVTQRREDQLAERRAQLTLELALLADRKNAKIISLLEALRRDDPPSPTVRIPRRRT